MRKKKVSCTGKARMMKCGHGGRWQKAIEKRGAEEAQGINEKLSVFSSEVTSCSGRGH